MLVNRQPWPPSPRLGTPAVFIATTGRGYTNDQQRVRFLTEQQFDSALEAITEMVARPPDFWIEARNRLLAEKIDVTEWMTTYFEQEFPENLNNLTFLNLESNRPSIPEKTKFAGWLVF